MSTYIYVRNSQRAGLVRRLARALNIRVVDSGTRLRAGPRNSLICWGNSLIPEHSTHGTFWLGNTPEHVALASHKTNTLRALSDAGVPTLDYTTDRAEAQLWLHEGMGVYARTILQGHSAEGLVYVDPRLENQTVPHAPLYTKDFGTPFKEYRVHVAFGRVIDVTQKRRLSQEELLARNEQVPADRERLQVRTYGNGWVFCRTDIDNHQDIRTVAIRAAQALDNMPMAAVDIVAKWSHSRPTEIAVMEINSAPALRSDTLLAAYVNALRHHTNRTTPIPITWPETLLSTEDDVVVEEPPIVEERVEPVPEAERTVQDRTMGEILRGDRPGPVQPTATIDFAGIERRVAAQVMAVLQAPSTTDQVFRDIEERIDSLILERTPTPQAPILTEIEVTQLRRLLAAFN